MSYQFILAPYNGLKSRHHCTGCAKPRVFSRYIDQNSKESLHESVGRCNRAVKCGYHYTPKEYFSTNGLEYKPAPFKQVSILKTKVFSTIENSLLAKSLTSEKTNNFLMYLASLFDTDTIAMLQQKYRIGTSKVWQGATIFWQVDTQRKIRSGKIMLYDTTSGKRVKKPYPHITWVHKAIKSTYFNLQQCFYGAHLLSANTNPIAIVESEKTAIIASVYLPEFVWLATGSLSNLNLENTKTLHNRQAILFPDLGAYDTWQSKIPKLYPKAHYQISNLLERKATTKERAAGWDIADYLIALSLKIDHF